MSSQDLNFMDGPRHRRPRRNVRPDTALLSPLEIDFAHAFATGRRGSGGCDPQVAYRRYRQALTARNRQRPSSKLRLMPFKVFLKETLRHSGTSSSSGKTHIIGSSSEGER